MKLSFRKGGVANIGFSLPKRFRNASAKIRKELCLEYGGNYGALEHLDSNLMVMGLLTLENPSGEGYVLPTGRLW